jgi:hypothetical protein
MLIEDVVALQPRPLPPVILERAPGSALEIDMVNEGVGLLDIRSVYDFDGVDVAPGGIRALADPRLATAAQRPARFLRIEKAVGLPDEEVLEIPGSAFGVNAVHGMREILGYAPIEPDGSVRVKVPAGVPFAISVLDEDGSCAPARPSPATVVTTRPPAARTDGAMPSLPRTPARRWRACPSRPRRPRCSPTSARRWRRCVRACPARPTARR